MALQVASYTIEAKIVGFYDIPPLKESLNSMKESTEIFYGYYLNDVLAGIVSFKVFKNILDIHRLAVDPLYFRWGISEKILIFIETFDPDVDKIIVSTGKENLPAMSLYSKIWVSKKTKC